MASLGAASPRTSARHEEIDLVIAGRNPSAAATFIRSLGASRARSLTVDLARPDAISALLAAKPAILVDALGPFQARNLALPRRCAERGIHYIDIADARSRVADIASLDALGARRACRHHQRRIDRAGANDRRRGRARAKRARGRRHRRRYHPRAAHAARHGHSQGDPRLLRQADPGPCAATSRFSAGVTSPPCLPGAGRRAMAFQRRHAGTHPLARALPGTRRSHDSRRT